VTAEIEVEGSEHLAEPLRARDLKPEGREVGEASEVAGGEDVAEATALEEVSEALEEVFPARRGPVEERRGCGGRDVGRWLGLALPGSGCRERPPRPVPSLCVIAEELVYGGAEVLLLADDEALEGRQVLCGVRGAAARGVSCGQGLRRAVARAFAAVAASTSAMRSRSHGCGRPRATARAAARASVGSSRGRRRRRSGSHGRGRRRAAARAAATASTSARRNRSHGRGRR